MDWKEAMYSTYFVYSLHAVKKKKMATKAGKWKLWNECK
jgi:hypothetical protein